MSDLGRQEIFTIVDNMEVDAMAIDAKRKGDTNKIELEATDPLDWTINQIVALLCHNTSTPWSQSANPSQRPEAALRENLINGDVLLRGVGRALLNDMDKVILRALEPWTSWHGA